MLIGMTDAPVSRARSQEAPRSEQELASGLASADPATLQEFFIRSHEAVFAMSSRLAPTLDLARDWTHDVLLGLVHDVQRGRFVWRRPGSFWAWFRKRAYYRLLSAYRRERLRRDREHLAPDGDGAEESVLVEIAGGDDPESELDRVRLIELFERCLAEVPNADQRQALWLFLRADQSIEAISASMEAPANTVKAWIRRSRIAVRLCMARAMEIPDAAEPCNLDAGSTRVSGEGPDGPT
jgi:RNA polymerase sigma factor (sigma-70 family)